MRIETAIIKGLLQDDIFCRQVVPHLNEGYFEEYRENKLVVEIAKFFNEYNKLPTKESIYISLENRTDLSDEALDGAISYLKEIDVSEKNDTEWLIRETETFVKERAVINAIHEAIAIQSGEDKDRDSSAIPSLLTEALGVSFDKSVGHDYMEDAEARWDYYHKAEEKLAFDIDILNKITDGGLSNKTLNLVMAATGVGKSLVMCHMAGHHLMAGHNVLYISMEMGEERLAERIDSRIFNVPIKDVKNINKESFNNKIGNIRSKTAGRLVFKEFPTGGAHVGHFRALIEELKIKKDFTPRVIYIDYLNICASARMKMGGSVNSYAYIKSIAEEIRGLAVEYDIPIITATQTNRTGSNSSDPNLEDTSESFGLPMTVDLMLALVSGEELEEMGQIMWKQLKNRYGDLGYYKKFVTGIDKSKMMLYNLEESAQSDLQNVGKPKDKDGYAEDKPLFDESIKSDSAKDFNNWKF